MDKKPRFIFSNQYSGYLFIDIVNAFAEHYNGVLYAGKVDSANRPVASNIRQKLLKKYNRDTPARRIYTWGMYTVQLFFKTLRTSKDTELFIVTNPPFPPFIGMFLKRFRKVNYHLLVYDVYPDVLVNFGMFNKESLLVRYWSKKNSTLFKYASTIYTLSESMADLIRAYNPNVKVEVIPNWSDGSYIKPLKKTENHFASQYNQVDKITVMYSGNMGATHAVEKVGELASIFQNDSSLGFMMIGGGAKKSLLERMKKEENLDNLILLPFQDASLLPYSIPCADVGVVTLSSGAEDLSVPSKTYNLLAAGVSLLVIASHNSELARLVKKYNCGAVFAEDQVTEMAEYLRQLKADRARLEELKKNARVASADFTPENAKEYVRRLNSNVNVSQNS